MYSLYYKDIYYCIIYCIRISVFICCTCMVDFYPIYLILFAMTVSSDLKSSLLQAHNDYRQNHATPPLAWSDTLAAHAQKWADELARKGRLEHCDAKSRQGEGENLACAGGKELTGSGATQMWYDEIKDYDFNQPAKYNPQCGHFTQVVWYNTKEVGAGISKGDNGMTYVVARYAPAGNMLSKFVENIMPLSDGAEGDKENVKGVVDNNKEIMMNRNSMKRKSEEPIVDIKNGVDFKSSMLQAHNEYRKKHNTRALQWSDQLASNAQQWANHLAKLGKLQHAQKYEREGQGENLAYASGKELTGSGSTQMWYDEIKDYNFNQPAKYNPQCGHFTQVVWAASTELGGGIATVGGKTFVVARYSPPGNMLSKFEENVKHLGGIEDLTETTKRDLPESKKSKTNSVINVRNESPPVLNISETNDDVTGDDSINNNNNIEDDEKDENKSKVDVHPSKVDYGRSNEAFEMDTNMNHTDALYFKSSMLQAHNNYRKKHNTPDLQWSDQLASNAQQWANHLAKLGKLQHAQKHEREGQGENLAYASGKELTGSSATQMWYDEIKDYDFNQPAKYNPQCGHFTQVVWAASKEFGGGIATVGGKTFVVARYSPPGNMLSKFEENVKHLGGIEDLTETTEKDLPESKKSKTNSVIKARNESLSKTPTNNNKDNEEDEIGSKVNIHPSKVDYGHTNKAFEENVKTLGGNGEFAETTESDILPEPKSPSLLSRISATWQRIRRSFRSCFAR